MKKSILLVMLSMMFIFSLTGCKNRTKTPVTLTPTETEIPSTGEDVQTPTKTETKEPTQNKEEYIETNLEDGKRRIPYVLKVFDNGNNIIYFGQKFKAEGYVVKFVYEELDNMGTGLPLFSAVTLTNFGIDDSKVDYRKEGRYPVKISGRVGSDILTVNVFITIKADKYEYLGVKHLYGLSCDEFVNCAVGTDISSVIPSELYAIYTENKYDNGELVKISEKIRSGYELDTTEVDTNTAGQYPVYVSYSKTYGEVTITVSTFFILVVA